MTATRLPYLDEHTTTVAAGVGDVWAVLTETLDRTFSRGLAPYARMIGCADPTASGPRPLASGSTVPGFRVAAATPGSTLVLEGRHRFSAYTLTFRLDQLDPASTRLRAESRAAFPGPAGALYRLLVVGTGGHAIAVRRLLAAIASRCGPGRR